MIPFVRSLLTQLWVCTGLFKLFCVHFSNQLKLIFCNRGRLRSHQADVTLCVWLGAGSPFLRRASLGMSLDYPIVNKWKVGWIKKKSELLSKRVCSRSYLGLSRVAPSLHLDQYPAKVHSKYCDRFLIENLDTKRGHINTTCIEEIKRLHLLFSRGGGIKRTVQTKLNVKSEAAEFGSAYYYTLLHLS